MSIFDARPSYRVGLPFESARVALELPLSPLRNMGQQTDQAIFDSFGLGSAVKDFVTPRGVPQPGSPAEQGIRGGLEASPLTGPLVRGYDAMRELFGAKTTGAPMSEEEWKASPYYRTDITWDAGMTTDRAAAIATQFDVRRARQFFGEKDMLTTILGGLGGGIFDPINFVPVFGPAARLAATTRFGLIAGHALVGASEAAINTAVFGALTTPFRARLGEDVSWQAAINNIAFSAVIGAAFGGIGGTFAQVGGMRAARADIESRLAMESIRNLKASRDVVGDAVGSVIDTGDVKLTPRSAAIIERITTEANDRRVAARALETETQGVTGTKAGEVVIAPSGARVAVRAEVVEASSLQRATGALQVRDRSPDNAVSNAQIEDIALNLDPARLMPSVDGSQGAPVVGADGIIDSGNGRVMAINRAYEAYPDKAAGYRQALVDAGYPEAATMDRPVLVQRRLTDLSSEARAQFNAEVNGPTTARMSAVELAAMDRGALTDDVLDQYAPGAEIASAGNRAFVARFLANLPQNERGALIDKNGYLNADGVRRIENAMVAAAYGDVDSVALNKFASATDDNTRAIVGALADVAGNWVRLRRAIARGEISPDFDMTPELTEALRRLSAWRDQAAREGRPVSTVIKEGMAQGDMLSGDMPAATKLFVRSFYKSADFTGAAGRDTITGRLNDLVDAALELGQPDMLGAAYAATKLGVLKRVYSDLETDFLETASVRAGDDALGGTGGESGPGPGSQENQGQAGGNRSGGDTAGAGPDGRADVEENLRSPEEIAMPIAGTVDEQLAQIAALTGENLPILDDLIARIDAALGTESKVNVKEPAKIVEKSRRPSILAKKPWFTMAHVRDTLRFKTVISSLDQVADAFRMLADAGVSLVKIDTGKLFAPKEWGWRIIAFDMRMPNGQLVEWYLPIKELEAQKKAEGHLIFEEWRDKTPEELEAQKADYLAAIQKSFDGYNQAFGAALSRMGLTETEARASWSKVEASLPSILTNSDRSSGGMAGTVIASAQTPPLRTNAGPSSGIISTRSSPPDSNNTRSLIPGDIGAEPGRAQGAAEPQFGTGMIAMALDRAGFAEVPDPMSSISRYMNGWVPSGERVTDMSTSRVTEPLYRAIEAAKTPDEAHLAADAWVLDMGKLNGDEHLVMFDGDAGLMMVGRGGERFVGIPDPLIKRLENGEVHYATHNHPRNSGLSADDLIMMFAGSNKAPDAMAITAMGSKGAVVTARPGPAFAKLKGKMENWAEIGRAISLVQATVRGHMMNMVRTGEMTAETFNIDGTHAHIENIVMHRLGWIDLRSNGADFVNQAGLGHIADKVLREAKDGFEHIARRAGLEFTGIRDFDPARRPGGATDGSARADGGGSDRLPQRSAPDTTGRVRHRGGRVERSPDQLALFERADPVGSPAFKAWFGNSKVVDAEGKPLVVYHGTARAFDAFGNGGGGRASDVGKFFFTDDADFARDIANDRADAGEGQARVVPAYLSLKNPLEIEVPGGRRGEYAGSPVLWWDAQPGEWWAQNVEAGGYDGLIIRGEESPMFVASRPTQIKSVNNRGTFDPNDPRILADSDQPFSLLDDARRIAGEDQPDMFAGANLGRSPPPTVDMQEPRPEPPPEGLEAAAARVGKPDDIKALAEQFGVDENGGFLEQADIDQLRAEGRLSADDLAELEAADRTYADTETYGEMLRAAVACVMN